MLYIVATPIGNLQEITYRAVEILKSVDYIACEDTRTSKVLLDYYVIKNKLVAYHKFNEIESGEKLVEKLKSGKNIALITDAGMPVISDPGNVLVNMLIENIGCLIGEYVSYYTSAHNTVKLIIMGNYSFVIACGKQGIEYLYLFHCACISLCLDEVAYFVGLKDEDESDKLEKSETAKKD